MRVFVQYTHAQYYLEGVIGGGRGLSVRPCTCTTLYVNMYNALTVYIVWFLYILFSSRHRLSPHCCNAVQLIYNTDAKLQGI